MRKYRRALFLVIVVLVHCQSCMTILRSREELNIQDYKILLTLDDGPSETPMLDEQILDILKRKQVKVCFSLLTYKLDGKGEILKRMIMEGHTIVFHSKRHEQYLLKDYAQFEKELEEFENTIRDETGMEITIKYFRPPAGVISKSFEKKLNSQGIKLLYASHNPTDTFVNKKSSSQYIKKLIHRFEMRKGGIMVLHNGSELFPRPSTKDFLDENSAANRLWIADAIELIIDTFNSKGFQFMDINELEKIY